MSAHRLFHKAKAWRAYSLTETSGFGQVVAFDSPRTNYRVYVRREKARGLMVRITAMRPDWDPAAVDDDTLVAQKEWSFIPDRAELEAVLAIIAAASGKAHRS